jgi:hypothetical protein
MSREIIVKIRDDLDRGLDADETIDLMIDDVTYVIDLCAANAAALREALRPYLEAAHEKRRGTKSSPNNEQRREHQLIRKWARTHGFEIGEKGQIPVEVREAFARFQPKKEIKKEPQMVLLPRRSRQGGHPPTSCPTVAGER